MNELDFDEKFLIDFEVVGKSVDFDGWWQNLLKLVLVDKRERDRERERHRERERERKREGGE